MAGKSGSHWQCQLASTGERLALLRETGLLSDLTITFPGQPPVLKAHRLVLAMSSPVFEAMLCGPLAEGDVLRLPEDPPDAFEWILDHLYRDVNQLPNVQMAIKVYQLAAKYQMDVLCDICSQYLICEVNAHNFPMIFDAAVLLEDGSLLNRCGEIMAVSSDEVLGSPQFYQLRQSSVKSLLLHQDLAPSSETLVFKALLRWAEKNLDEDELIPGVCASPQHSMSPTSAASHSSSNIQDQRILAEPKNSSKTDSKKSASPSKISSRRGEPLLTTGKETVVSTPVQRKGKILFPTRDKLRSEMEDFLPHIRFLSMTTDEFVSEVLSSYVLTNDESVSILMNIKGVPNVPLPTILTSYDKKKRKNKVKSSTVMFCQHHFSINDQEILRQMHVSRSIFICRITAPAVLSNNDAATTILVSSPFPRVLAKAKWRGTSCKFEHPVKLVPEELYSVLVASAYGPCSGCECEVSSDHEGLDITAKTLGLSPVYFEYWEAD